MCIRDSPDGGIDLYHTGTKVAETTANGFTVTTSAGADVAVFDGAAELYHAGVKKFETTATGAAVTGDLEYLNISTVTAETTASNADVILASGGPYTVSLEEKDRAIIRVKYIDSGSTITVQGLSGTIDGSANTTLTSQYESVTVVCNGTNWFIV